MTTFKTDLKTDLKTTQWAIEEEAVGLGIERYNKDRPLPWRDTTSSSKDETDMAPGKELLNRSLDSLTATIVDFFEKATSGKAGRRHAIVKLVGGHDPAVLAYMTARGAINGASQRRALSQVAIGIGTMIQDNKMASDFAQSDPGLYRRVQEQIKKSTSGRHKLAVVRNAMRTANVTSDEWNEQDRLRIGEKLLDLYIQSSNVVTIETEKTAANKSRLLLSLTKEADEWITKSHEKCALMSPLYLPMVVRPDDWTNPLDGGYLTPTLKRRMSLIRTRKRATIDEFFSTDMPEVYNAVNAIQSTPWKINRNILKVARELWSTGGALGGLPVHDDKPLPPKTWAEDEEPGEKELKDWKRQAAGVYEENGKMVSKRMAVSQKLWMAERFEEFDAIYFPHSLDFRGRIYSMVPFLDPQGDDLSKALLSFSEGKPLGESGAYWLAVHIANLFGHDKLPLDERAQWTVDNTNMILDCAFNPMDGERGWLDADDPFCALAACYEWAGYHLEGEDYVSHLPIAMDGSCSGLQHFSAMLRDPIGGGAVNLIPQERPADIYTQVATKVQSWVDSSSDVEAAPWKGGKVVRKIVKQPTMTYAYSATRYGMQQQIESALKKLDEDSYVGHLEGADNYKAAKYLSGLVLEGIREVVVAAAAAMDWLKEVATVASRDELPVCWTSPVGLPVIQDYRELISNKVNLHIHGQRMRVTLSRDGDKMSKRRQASGIAPNFIHSMDAAHLMKTVNACQEIGINSFAMIHDSFGVHACDTDELNVLLREEFIAMYQEDHLAAFRGELEEQLTEELIEELPPVPSKGTLDLEGVRESDFFFS